MVKAIITDFSKVLLFPIDKSYEGSLNALNNNLLQKDENYKFEDHFELNTELLNYYKDLNSRIPVYIFTSETIQDHPSIRDLVVSSVTDVLSAKKIGVNKSEPAAFERILEQLELDPIQVLYIDDNQSNINNAESVGLNTILYTANDAVINIVEELTAQ